MANNIRTLLVVEDELDLLNIIGEHAARWQLKVLLAENIQKAAEYFRNEEVTAVLSDISMPGGTGIDFLQQVRASGSNIPFIFLTANTQREMMREALQLGATDFIDKPFSVEKLEEIVFKGLEIGTRLQQIKQSAPTKEEIERQEKMINLLRLTLTKN